MFSSRNEQRLNVDIPVTVTTVLESADAAIVDLSHWGAKVVGAGLKPGAAIIIDVDGYSVFATVRWSEVDRMGVRFLSPLAEGPLFTALEMAEAAQRAPLRAPPQGFGRRNAGL